MQGLELPQNILSALDNASLANKGDLAKFTSDIGKAFLPDVPMLTRDGGFIAPGWAVDLDELKKLRDDSRKIVASLQADYAKAADVPTLKIKHNNVLGYFIEVTPKYADAMLAKGADSQFTVSYTHLRAHETEADLVCRLLLEKKN